MGRLFRVAGQAAVVAVLWAGAGCMSGQGRPGWGDDALWPVDGQRIGQAAVRALLDPQTWVPAAGALAFTIDGWDDRVSHWASDRTPLFGSQENAALTSDHLWRFLEIEMPVTALLTPSGDSPEQWAVSKARGLVVEYGAIAANGYATGGLKNAVGRERPNALDRKSFPSGHSSSSCANATLCNRNLDWIEMPSGLRSTLQIGNLGLVGAVAWARVEARVHHPSDVLAGAALGHFLAAFIHDAFMNLPEDGPVNVAVTPAGRGAMVSVAWRF